MNSAARLLVHSCHWLILVWIGLGMAVGADYSAQLFPNGPAPYRAYGGEVWIGRAGERLLIALRIGDPAQTGFHQVKLTGPNREVVTVPLEPPTAYVDPAAQPGSPGWGHVDYSAFFELPANAAVTLLAGSWLIEVGEPGGDGSLSSQPVLPLPEWAWRYPTPGNREPGEERAVGIAHGAGRYVTLMLGQMSSLSSSPDGLLWEEYSLAPAESPQTVAWVGDRFLAVGHIENSMLILSSTNGVTWSHRRLRTQPDDGLLSEIALQNGVYALQGFVRYGRRTTGTVVLTSRDAENWVAKYDPVPTQVGVSAGHRNLVAGNGVFLRLAWTFATTAGLPEVSTNGVDWLAAPGPVRQFTSVAFGNGTFLAIDIDGNLMASLDGRAWNRVGALPTPTPYVPMAFAGGAFFIPSGNELFASLTGASWSRSLFPSNVVVTTVARGQETFCAAGYRMRLTSEAPSGPDAGAVIYQSGAPVPWTTRVSRPRIDAAGRLWVAVQATPGNPVGLQVAADLGTWTDLAVQSNPEGIVDFEIPPENRTARYSVFRARKVEAGTGP
ncbi:MAG: hypothetical protein JNK85_23990 [Verrucomicrobiales bacterium]|nr:hypothetical protein [Verrucomicrobiales bacterium]